MICLEVIFSLSEKLEDFTEASTALPTVKRLLSLGD